MKNKWSRRKKKLTPTSKNIAWRMFWICQGNNKEQAVEYGDDEAIVVKTKPIADLLPDVTIMFTDIVGFTAWSSVREPSQVLTLLEALYHAFDQIANKPRVFKLETSGDSYVAVAGLPESPTDHAVVTARFANECLLKIHILTKKFEVILGPDTGDLTMRAGLHSGPVTAGVLWGERSRFQLFGDMMNTASRMESTGVKENSDITGDSRSLDCYRKGALADPARGQSYG
jgi:class 3 adenylate cyclase